jgi:hypothetical protein
MHGLKIERRAVSQSQSREEIPDNDNVHRKQATIKIVHRVRVICNNLLPATIL